MKRFKQIFLTVLGVVFGLLALVFGLLNTKKFQDYTKEFIVYELRKKLDTDLDIGRLYFRPFNTIGIDSLYLLDKKDNNILLVSNVAANVDLYELLKRNVVITSARLSNFDVYLSKQSSDSVLNIQFLIDAFKPKEETTKSKLEFKVNALNIDGGNIYYDVLDKAEKREYFDSNHIGITNLNAKLALKSLQGDSLNLQIKKFGFQEKSGFQVENMEGRLISKNRSYSLKNFELLMPDSKIEFGKLDIELPVVDSDTTRAHIHEKDDIKFDFVLAESYISPKDISMFVPELQHFEDKVRVRANVEGTEHDVNMTNLTLTFGDKLKLLANAEVKDWDSDNAYVLAIIDELTTSGKDLDKLINSFSSKPVSLPQGIIKEENISFQGDLSGYISQLTAFGTLDTDDGVVMTDLLLGLNKKSKAFSFAKGKVYTTDFNLGDFLGNTNLGNTSFSISIDLAKPQNKEIGGEIKGDINSFDFKGYKYNDIKLDVNYQDKRVSGSLKIDDENGELMLIGELDVSNKKQMKIDVSLGVEDVQLGKLKLAKNLDYSYLSFDLRADFVGSTIDDMEGYLSIDSLTFYKDEDELILDKFLVTAVGASLNRKVEVTSDIIKGYIEGESSFRTIGNSLSQTMNLYLPAIFTDKGKRKQELNNNNFRFHFDIANTESISKILNLPVTIYEASTIDGFYENSVNLFKIEVSTPSIKAGGMKIYSGSVVAENSGDNISTTIKADLEGKNRTLNNIVLKALANEDKIQTTLNLQSKNSNVATGEFKLSAEFENLEGEGLHTNLKIGESSLFLNNASWKLDESTISIDNKFLQVNGFHLYTENKDQELKINGKYSKYDSSNILKTELKDIDLEYLFETLAIDALKFGGHASGNLFLSSIEEKPYANTRLNVSGFKFHGTELGDLSIFSELNDETQEVMLDGLITSQENKKTKVNGVIDPIKQELSIHFDADSIDIGFLHAYAESLFDKVGGRGTGQVHLHGDFSDVTVEGVAQIMDGTIGIKFLNAEYTFSDIVYLREGLIFFNDIEFRDQYGNKALGNGKIVHDYFQDIIYHIELAADNFLLYNATEQTNPLFYGQVYGSGKGVLSGDEQEVNIDINMKTQKNTLVRMNLMDNEISEYSFITYKEPKEPDQKSDIKLQPIVTKSGMNINMNFYIDATPDATIEMVMDPIGGDILRGSGEGALQFIWNSNLPPQLFGTYNVNRGSYNFTFQRIMERKFTIQDGSSVQFKGDPFEAGLDVTAIYRVTASLSDLDEDIANRTGLVNIPVHCILNLSGQLRHPSIGLDIAFPSVEAEIARQIKSYIDTEDMINRQVAYLLLLSKFDTSDIGTVEHRSSDLAVMASATLSNQLSKIINRVDSRWQLGTHIRMSDASLGSETRTEIELLLSSQLLNNRLLINGNFGYRDDPNISRDAVITDVDIEYLLNPSGTWRVKAYNHYNDRFYYRKRDEESVQTQGIGIIYRKDFDKFNELFPFMQKKKNIPASSTDTLHHVLPDSIKKGSELSDFIKIKK